MNKKGFTLVELLAVIAILAILVIIALPNIVSMFNSSKKSIFLTEAKTIYKEVSNKYIEETMKGNRITTISNDNNKLNLESNDLKYNIEINSDGTIKNFQVSNDSYCISGNYSSINDLSIDHVKDGKCDITSKITGSFATDDWNTIISNVKSGNGDYYNVGDTKTIELTGYGSHILRVANKSTSSECSSSDFSQTACGFVLEFVDIITRREMNETATNVGSWPATSMRTFLNNDIYNSLPSVLKNAIIDTMVISGAGLDNEEDIPIPFISIDKIYLLSLAEVVDVNEEDMRGIYASSMDTARYATRQLDYYKSFDYDDLQVRIKKILTNNSDTAWWLRSPAFGIDSDFAFFLGGSGIYSSYIANASQIGVSPAFRIN